MLHVNRFHRYMFFVWYACHSHRSYCIRNILPRLKILNLLINFWLMDHECEVTISIKYTLKKSQYIFTWLFFNAASRWYLTIYYGEFSICMRICHICFFNTVSCIRIVFNVNIGVYPYRSDMFEKSIYKNFLYVYLNLWVYNKSKLIWKMIR